MRNFFKGVKADWNKIIWSDKKTIIRETVAVIVFSAVICAFIVGVDTLTQYSVNFISGLIG
jgi:preprotein translocase subunit SecE